MMLQNKNYEAYPISKLCCSFTENKLEIILKQLNFIAEIDKLKSVLRRTKLIDQTKHENAAEHSWHITIMAIVLSQYATHDIDILKVLKMLLVHDLVEINAGDTYCYDKVSIKKQKSIEEKSAEKIFKILPNDQAVLFRNLWNEFENRKTAESKFANSIDRLQPFLNIYLSKGESWKQNNVKKNQVIRRMEPVKEGSIELWNIVNSFIDDAFEKGYLSE